MKSISTLLAVALCANLGLTVYLLYTKEDSAAASAGAPHSRASQEDSIKTLQQSLTQLRSQFRDLQVTLAGAPGDEEAEGDPTTDGPDRTGIQTLAQRLETMEQSIGRLQSAMNGISMESSSEERAKLFVSETGHLKADEYFEAEKYAIAGEGYLKFVEAHPDHPDHRGILERARSAFNRAGYRDKSLWVQEELMRIYPENRTDDLRTLARMKKGMGRYDEATKHFEEAANRDQSSQRYWDLLYAAWYTELDQGPQVGLDYLRTVQQQIVEAGYGEQKLGTRAQEKIDELERRVTSNP